ncbi:MAG: putative DNA helicase ino80 [Thelocarpon superellum]|nr:MAG: putative DNA helicase ino80 [Thelocarpon superellum]
MSGSSQQHSPFAARSPTVTHYDHAFSPTNGAYTRPSYHSQNHPPTPAALPMPAAAHSPRVRPPPSPPANGLTTMNGSPHRPREKATSTFYDPTLDQGTYESARNHHPSVRSPGQTQSKPNRTADPMAFANILSTSTAEPSATPAPPPPPSVYTQSAPKAPRAPARDSVGPAASPQESQPRPTARAAARQSSHRTTTPTVERTSKARGGGDGDDVHPPSVKTGKAKATSSDKENEATAVAAEIDDPELSDIDLPAFDDARAAFRERSRKRTLEIEEGEEAKRKRRRLAVTTRFGDVLFRFAQTGESRFRGKYGDEAVAEVQRREVLDEKERKKDMQRKRRREKTVQNEYQKRNEAIEKAQRAADEAEREKFVREAQRADKKARATKMILERGDGASAQELREVTPLAPNFEGGTMASFSLLTESIDPEPPKKKKSGRGGARPRKSKEQKQAEKDAAEAAHAAAQGGKPEPVTIAPKEDRREALKRESKEAKEAKEAKSKDKDVTPAPFIPFVSKGYNQIYDQIWRDLARKDIPRVYRIKEQSLSTKQSNLRKTAQLASKEARRWQLRTNKSMKDVQARAKRSMREMMSFWKRNEREERDLRRLAEKQELEMAKKAEADREANRQKRKLNFLISQTELYSHFVGAKVKTDEVERSTDSVDPAAAAAAKGSETGTAVVTTQPLPASDPSRPAAKVTNFENLDFDDDDESRLQDIARANAQNAVQEAQDRARAFNQGAAADSAADPDGEEMNFQNPTSLVDMDVAQPKMLTAQLKEYQLKGLNWLVNLYEQGINGILADEMGLGKTVQSISVMAYLAEAHNIWGPFLVIAPASTLHNWQQEITRFVPDLKVLPYWGNAKDRKVLRKFWDRKHITYGRESSFHVLVTSYQLVVQDTQYFQKIRWQYMILDEAQAIKSSQSSRWKSLLGFHCRNRLLLTGTPIQNNMQELWALLHFIMPSLFDSHDEFSDWFSKDIESHAQSNTKLNEDQLKRLHMILKPFMLRRIKKHVQKELGDKIELDVFCDLTYRQRAYYGNLRNRISIMDLIEKAAVGDDQDTATLMNLVMQFRKVCNHPDLFERAETSSPLSLAHFAETASFLREGPVVTVAYSTRNLIEWPVPRLLYRHGGRLDLPGNDNPRAGFRGKYLDHLMNVWTPDNIRQGEEAHGAFSWLRFADTSVQEVSQAFYESPFTRATRWRESDRPLDRFRVTYDDDEDQAFTPVHALLQITRRNDRPALAEVTNEGRLRSLMGVSRKVWEDSGLNQIEQCARPRASAPPIDVFCSSRSAEMEKEHLLFDLEVRRALFGPTELVEQKLVERKTNLAWFPPSKMLPAPISDKARYTNIQVPSMRRFVTDSGKLAKLDELLVQLKEGGHRVLLYFQMTRMIDLMEEYLTYRNYKYLRLDGSTKLEDRRDTVHDFQTRPEIFVFLLSTRAGGLGINLTAADTVIFYDSDWNPTIDSQAMDRAHRLGQTRQVTVYRMITRGTIEERIRKRALQKEEVQRVVISGGSGAGVDFNTRSRENRTKDIAMWLADDDQAAEIERKEAELAAAEAKEPLGRKKAGKKRKADVSLDDMYHEGEGHFDDGSNKPSGTATPVEAPASTARPRKGTSKKAKTAKERLRIADGDGGLEGR